MSYNLHVSIRKVLVANRGEIAVRIFRCLREKGIESVGVFTAVDRQALHVRTADECYAIGNYLDMASVIHIAVCAGADAIHPGYGFLSENAEFAQACAGAGIIFIGPAASSIARLGSKTEARKIAIEAGVPVVPGTTDAIEDVSKAHRIANEVGYPVMIKAAAGGGGKGMRLVSGDNELDAALREAASEAGRAFRNEAIYIEKYIQQPRHIEIQVLGDCHGHMVHLGERECSLQRRHQKVVEECPSPVMLRHPDLREAMGAAAIRVAQAAGYYNAGTVEFLVDAERNFYFLEMNTRLQVEHPVTELVTGIDLVDWQIRIAEGQPLTLKQPDVQWMGHAFECRLYAEDPEANFFPSPGLIEHASMPSGPGVRVDSGIVTGYTVPLDYDPLLAKIAVHGSSREVALARMVRAMGETHIRGIRTNAAFFCDILQDSKFAAGELHTGFIPEYFERRQEPPYDPALETVAALVTAASRKRAGTLLEGQAATSKWLLSGRSEALR